MKKLWLLFFMILAASGARAQDFPDKEVYQAVFENVQQHYLDKSYNLSDLSLEIIRALSEVDKDFKTADDGKRITLYYKARVLRSYLKPENGTDVKAQIKMLGKVLTTAQKASKKAAARDFELVDDVLEIGVRKALDGDSAYYPESGENSAQKLRAGVTFADRMIDNILYVRLRAFHDDTAAKLENSLQRHPEAAALILDLRGNPGGRLSEAVKIADLFLDEGIVISTSDRNGKNKYYTSTDGDVLKGRPMVLLVDAETASSAEALAVSLQEQSRAKVIGTSTYGKGSVQELFPLSNGAELGLTTAYFYAPSGAEMHGKGIVPDVCTFEMPESKNVDNLLRLPKDTACGAEKRGLKNLDIDAAAALLRQKI